MLESIESEDLTKLPEPVYVKGFIRSYALVIGVDGDSVIQNYLESRHNYPGITQLKGDFTKQSNKKRGSFWPRFIIGAVVMATIIAIVALVLSFYQDRYHFELVEPTDPAEKILTPKNDQPIPIKISEQPEKREQPEEINGEAIESLTQENDDEKEVVLPEKQPAFLNLSIVATADTWMKVIIDGEKPVEYLLKPGDKIALNADSHYNLLIGNAGGVQLNLNGQPVQIPGRMGQVVNLTLP